MSPFANANGRIARIVAMAIIRRYTSGGAMSLGSMPVTVRLCSDMMDSVFFGATPESFARFLFSRTLESTKRLYTYYGEILLDNVERRNEAEIAEDQWQEMSGRIKKGLLFQDGNDYNITNHVSGGGDSIDPIERSDSSVSNQTRDTMFEEAVTYLCEVRERIRIREEADGQMSQDTTCSEEATSDEEMASGEETTGSEEEESSDNPSGARGLAIAGSETNDEEKKPRDEDKSRKSEGSDEGQP